ncbi:hypothetical protein XELAEV_18021884mg [Xenopus laevis]|uniref:Uncharacterized protein n=1 Tax=Xenopus laevis TaxID=8355 RepID=A0A974D3Z0_XENLA|nr:hypothetical protein XELAEV_18021884mg [Xenopus laevis]
MWPSYTAPLSGRAPAGSQSLLYHTPLCYLHGLPMQLQKPSQTLQVYVSLCVTHLSVHSHSLGNSAHSQHPNLERSLTCIVSCLHSHSHSCIINTPVNSASHCLSLLPVLPRWSLKKGGSWGIGMQSSPGVPMLGTGMGSGVMGQRRLVK